MSDQQKYDVSAFELEDTTGTLVFTFVPQGQEQGGIGRRPRRVPRFVVEVHSGPSGLDYDWSGSPDNPGAAATDIQAEIANLWKERELWIGRVNELVGVVEQWAKELGWATRRVVKKLDDTTVGHHRVPALLMQADTCRIMLEPIGRSGFGVEGVVDLYLMPAYDDIARIYYQKGQWILHYSFPDAKATATSRESEAFPLTKEILAKVLEELRLNAV
jgi:hypothetical protein